MTDLPVVRFAPSPTGYLHPGNIRTALFNYLHARHQGGRVVLRIDDTDPHRSRKHYSDALMTDLDWLGLTSDQVVWQSARTEHYAAAAERLKARGLLYRCYESTDELARKRRIQLAQKRPPVYDRTGLQLSDRDHAAFAAEGRQPHWRFRLSGDVVTVADTIQGSIVVAMAGQSDPVLVRADGGMLYNLPSVVDDIDLGITMIIRGADHCVNAAIQVELFRALDATAPDFAHHGLLVDATGQGFSKRSGTGAIRDLRADGVEPIAILSYLAGLGTAGGIVAMDDLAALADHFDLAAVHRGDAGFDIRALKALHLRYLRQFSYTAMESRLQAVGLDQADAAFWNGVRGNLTRFDEIVMWWRILREPLTPIIDDYALCQQARATLPSEPWNDDDIAAWLKQLAATSGRRGKALFLPLRRALTGRDHGPDMAHLLPLIGARCCAGRLNGETI